MSYDSLVHRGRWQRPLMMLLTIGGLTACGGGGSGASENSAATTAKSAQIATKSAALSSDESDDTPASSGAATAGDLSDALQKSSSGKVLVQPPNTEGRLLASNCFQCHGTLGRGGFDSIRGDEAEEIDEFLTKAANKDIMAAHAQGYTPAQIQKIIAYLQQ